MMRQVRLDIPAQSVEEAISALRKPQVLVFIHNHPLFLQCLEVLVQSTLCLAYQPRTQQRFNESDFRHRHLEWLVLKPFAELGVTLSERIEHQMMIACQAPHKVVKRVEI